MTDPNGNGAITSHLEALRCDMTEVKSALLALAADYRAYREMSAVLAARTSDSVQAAHLKIDKMETRIKSLEDSHSQIERELATIAQRVNILVGIVSFIGVAVGGWIVSQLLAVLK